jgi:hypothetical protein
MADFVSRALEDALARVPDLKSRYEAVSDDLGLPLAGSPEWRDRLSGWGGDWPGSFASVSLHVAIDHLFAWYVLGTPPEATMPTHAHLTVLRSAIECAVQARWFIDTQVTTGERIARALGERFANLDWSRKVEADVSREGTADPELVAAATTPSAAEKTRDLVAKADAEHIRPIRMLDTVALLDKYPQEPGSSDVVWWRYTSGVAHGQMWAATLGEREVVRAGATVTRYKESANETVAAGLTNIAADRVNRAIEELHLYREPPIRD